jgi:heme-degrading monooxygenase HmoA
VFARSTTITAQQPSAIERGIMFVQSEVMPDIALEPGFVGLSLLVDHATGQCITTSAWLDEESMRATTETVRPLRNRFVTEVGGSAPIVDEWKIALMHRDHHSMEGARARASWLQGDPASIDDAVESYRAILPSLDELPGFCSASLLINQETGRAVSTVIYDGSDTLAQTRARASELRSYVAEQTGVEVIEVAEFELAFAHLRVPEMA